MLEIHNFLDGRLVSMYWYLHFSTVPDEDSQVFAIDQTYYFEDRLCTHPQLFEYTLFPCIPADPFDFISTYPDNEPLWLLVSSHI